MDREKMEKLERLLAADEIYRAYSASADELEADFSRIAQRLGPEERRILVGFRECRKLMQLRERTLVCENMEFAEH